MMNQIRKQGNITQTKGASKTVCDAESKLDNEIENVPQNDEKQAPRVFLPSKPRVTQRLQAQAKSIALSLKKSRPDFMLHSDRANNRKIRPV